MTTAAAPTTPAANGAAPSDLSGGESTAEPTGAEAESSASEERSDLNALLERRQPPKAKAKKAEANGPDDETEEPAEGEEPSEPEAQAEPVKPEELTAEKLFSAEALETPEGLKRAREVVLHAKADLEKRHRRFDRADMKLKRREAEVVNGKAWVEQQRGQVHRLHQIGQTFMGKMEIIRGARLAKPEIIMATLDELAGGPGDHEAGARLAEQLLLAVHADGQAPKASRAEEQLRGEMEQLRRQREADIAAARAEREALEMNHLKGSIGQLTRVVHTTANNPQAFPSIAAAVSDPEADITAEGVTEWVTEAMESHFEEHGTPLDMREAIGILETKLSRFYGKRAPQGETAAASQTRPRQGAPRRAAPTVLPASADLSSGRGRPLTHEENLAELARDPEFMGQLFGRTARA
jgi:hypothetical protein